LHKRLHRQTYFDIVNRLVENAYNNGSKNKTARGKRVDAAVKKVRNALKELNKAAPF